MEESISKDLVLHCIEIYMGNYTKEQQMAASIILKIYYKDKFQELMDYMKDATGFKVNNRLSGKYKTWSKKIKERANNKCEMCGTNKNLHSHHIIEWKYSINGRFDLDNGKCLCNKCHKYVHSDKYIYDLFGRGDLYA